MLPEEVKHVQLLGSSSRLDFLVCKCKNFGGAPAGRDLGGKD